MLKLYTATLVASAGDTCEGGSNTECLAVPSAVTLCLQVTSDLVLAAVDDADGGSKYVPDAMSAEHAVGVIEALLPSMLQTGEPPHKPFKGRKEGSSTSAARRQINSKSCEGVVRGSALIKFPLITC